MRLIADIIECTEALSIPGIALFLDFKKAFVSIEWNFIFKTLETLAFNLPLLQWVRTFYNNIQSCVVNNGHTTPFFELERCIRQGCPLSCILFVIAVETLANSIRNDQLIEGINIIKGREYKVFKFADDTSCFINGFNSIQKLFQKLKLFYNKNCLGLELNKSKMEAMWAGKTRPQPATLLV